MASVLETFYILFESNADELKKGEEDATKTGDKLEQRLSGVNKGALSAGESFVQMASKAAGALGAVLSLGAIVGAVFRAADFADKVGEFSSRLDLSVESVTAWGDAVQVNGGSAESFMGSIDSLSDALTTFAVKGTSRVAPFFQELGIQMVDAEGKARNVMDILPELATSFDGLSKQESAALGRKIGLDQGTIMLLQRGRREVEEQIQQQKELGVITTRQAEIAGEYNDTWDNTVKIFRNLFATVGQSVLPVFTSILNAIQTGAKFAQKHSDFIVGLMVALGTAISVYVIPPLVSMAIAAITAFAPFILIGVAVAAVAAAFALLYDDVMNFIDGNDSLIGQILTEYPMIASILEGIGDALMGVWEVIKWVFDTLLSILQISAEGWKMLGDVIGGWVSDFVANSSIIQGVIGDMLYVFQAFGDAAGAVWDWVGEKVRAFIELAAKGIELVKSVGSYISEGLDATKSILGIGAAQDSIALASSSPINTQTSNVTSNSQKSSSKSTTVQTGPITVQTQATDGDSVAEAMGRTLGDQIRQANASMDDGVMA